MANGHVQEERKTDYAKRSLGADDGAAITGKEALPEVDGAESEGSSHTQKKL